MTKQGRVWIVAGALLDLAAAVLIARNVPQIGPPLAAGVGLLLIGSVMVFQGVMRMSRERAEQQPASRDALPAWNPEPELSVAPPRPVRLTRTGMLSAGLWGAMALVVVAYVFLAPPRAVRVPQLLEVAGATATATVHAKNERQTASGGPIYYVSFHFETVQGQQVRESQSVLRTVYDQLAVGDSFEVIYLPENPQQSFAPQLERREMPALVRWIAVGVLAAMLFVLDQQRRFHKRLVAYGKPVAGLVEGVRRRGANRVFAVRYKLHGQEGTLRGSERNPLRADGDAVTVLYLPERPERALLYRTSLYRARGK
jgi:Protein of unknown function (DUF3592)